MCTLEISVSGEGVSVSESYTIIAGKDGQTFTLDGLPSGVFVSVNIVISQGGKPLWKPKAVPRILLSEGDNIVSVQMEKVDSEEAAVFGFSLVVQNGGKEGQASVQESAENPAEAVFTNKDVKDLLSIWDYHLDMKNPFSSEPGKNYRLSIEMKADKNTFAFIEAKAEAVSYSGSQTFCEVGTEYKTFSVVTGNISSSWPVDRFKIACGTAEKLYVRNFTVEETAENQNFVFGPWCGTASGYGCVSAEEISETEVKVAFINSDAIKNPGINIIPINRPLDVNSIYRLSFNVASDTDLRPDPDASDSDEKTIEIWSHGISNETETAGSNRFEFDANTPKNIVLYVVSYQNENEDFRVPQLWLRSQKDCVLTVSGIKWEKTTIEEIKRENQSLDLYFAGDIGGGWTGYIPNSKSVRIRKNTEGNGQFLLCDSNGWDSTENATTSFRILEEGTGSAINASVKTMNGDTRIHFKNTSADEDIYVKFSLNSKNQVVIERAEEPTELYGEYLYGTLYVRGDFNQWATNEEFALNDVHEKNDDGNGNKEYEFEFSATSETVNFKISDASWNFQYGGGTATSVGDYVLFPQMKEFNSVIEPATGRKIPGRKENAVYDPDNAIISGLQNDYIYILSIKIDSEGKAYFKASEKGRAPAPLLSGISAVYNEKGSAYPFTRQTGDPLSLPQASDFTITEHYTDLTGTTGYDTQITDGTGYSVSWKEGVDESAAIGNVPCVITKDGGSVSCETSVEVKYDKYVYGVLTQPQTYEAEKSSTPFRIGEEINPKTWQVWSSESSHMEKTDTLKFQWYKVESSGNQGISGNNSGCYYADVSAEGETRYRRLFSIETPADISFYAGDTNTVSTDFTVTVKPAPEFASASFSIPSARINKKNTSVTASVTGKNFKIAGLSESSFSVACPTDSSLGSNASLSVISDTELSLTLPVSGNPGEHTVRITVGNSSTEGVFSVKDYSDWKSGNIILADGSTVEPADYSSVDASNPPVAVAIDGSLYYNQNEERYGVGLKSVSGQDWAKNETTGYTTLFTDIVCTPSSTGSGTADSSSFEGDTDGSDNWNLICSKDSLGSEDASVNYPAFDWVNKYGTSYTDSLVGGAIGICLASLSSVMYTDAKIR